MNKPPVAIELDRAQAEALRRACVHMVRALDVVLVVTTSPRPVATVTTTAVDKRDTTR